MHAIAAKEWIIRRELEEMLIPTNLMQTSEQRNIPFVDDSST